MAGLSFSLIDNIPGSHTNVSYDAKTNKYILFYPCQRMSTCTEYFSVFAKGRYFLEVWGSQGSSFRTGVGGKGGYAKGTLTIEQQTKAFFSIGGRSESKQPSDGTKSEISYNGGGKSGYANHGAAGSPGGGGTDIRLIVDDFQHRILVGGGGGGGGRWDFDTRTYYGGFGGGESGGNGQKYYQGYDGSVGGNQQSGGTGSNPKAGIFGIGGSSPRCGSGGGGGWYGGSAGQDGGSSGGGGSGYANTLESIKPSDYAFQNSFFLSETEITPNVHSGIGFISITVLSFSRKTKIHRFHLHISLSYVLSLYVSE